jgi:hypothetical protein|tara:strand:- start:17676 stop:18890 length:1215 start_codon:yes stop_codon:yes gene_type:complete
MLKSKYLIFLPYLFLLLAFYFGVDPNGGAWKDYLYHKSVIEDFKIDFFGTFFNYDDYSSRHSPVLLIFLSAFVKFEIHDYLIRLFFLHVCLLLPIIFYKCLILKFKSVRKDYLKLFACIIFLSPSFLSLTIWPDSRILGLLLFSLSIFYFLKFKEDKAFLTAIKTIFFYTAASYISPNFSVFSVYFFYFFFKRFKISREIFLIVLLNFILALPAIIYTLSLDEIFLFQSAVPDNTIQKNDYFNISNKILVISSIIFFYCLPFLLTKSIKIKIIDYKNIILSFLFLAILSVGFNYNPNYTGGGIFFKISHHLLGNNYLFFIVSFFSILFLLSVIKISKQNLLIIFLLILSNPQFTIYHKYYDPFILILFLLLFKINFNKQNLFNFKTIFIFYLHMGGFLILNFIK